MYNLDEIKLQNQQDCLTRMYMEVAGSIYENAGRKAEGIIREAVRRYGADRGKELKEKHLNNGVKTNLLSLFTVGCDCKDDPRVRKNIIEQNEQVRLWEVYTCPMADMWNRNSKGKLGSFYCEECTHALVNAYTEEKGQTNLSNMLTCKRDNFCRFSVYFRPANLTDEKKALCFGENKEASVKNALHTMETVDFKQSVNSMFIKLYYYLLEVSKERLGEEGVCIVALGLRKLAQSTVNAIALQADHTGNPTDQKFIDKNFPLNIDSNNEPLWERYNNHNAKELIDINFLIPLIKQLGI